MIVVSDTTAVSNLLTIGLEDLLPSLFERVVIPVAVRVELLAWHKQIPPWLEFHPVQGVGTVARLQQTLDRGEAEAIALTLELHPDWLLMDEAAGRRIAKAYGVPILGLLGVLLLAKQRGLIAEVASIVANPFLWHST